mgnify:CR=1 FL=1
MLSRSSRVAASLNHAVGLDALVCDDVAHYEERIVALALDRPERERLRAHLARARTDSALFDSERFTRDIEALYERMLARHDAGLAAAPPFPFLFVRGTRAR